jgi:hypothetical protein
VNINELTLGQLKEIQSMCGTKSGGEKLPLDEGKNYFIRTVTLYYTGKLKRLTRKAIVLSDAAWIADTGRFHQFLKEGSVNEVEPFISDVVIPVDSVIDATEWQHALPVKQK